MNPRALSFLGWAVIILTLFTALTLTIFPLPSAVKDFRPAFLLLFVLAWVILLPHRVNVGIAWVSGLTLDSLQGILLGENAISFTVLAYLVFKIHRQMQLLSYFSQAAIIGSLLLIHQTLLFWFQGLQGGVVSMRWFFGTAASSALFWPLIFVFIKFLIKQRSLD